MAKTKTKTCEGTVPETRVAVVDQATGEATEQVIPEHACEAPASMLARSMQEVTCSEGAPHWRRTEDHLWCPSHYQPGTMTHLSGAVSEHPAMAPDEYQE